MKPELVEQHGKEIVDVLLTPFEQSAHLAGMMYGEPFITYNVGPLSRRGSVSEEELATGAQPW